MNRPPASNSDTHDVYFFVTSMIESACTDSGGRPSRASVRVMGLARK
jgi:hypothetical protein